MGAWIETLRNAEYFTQKASHPMWVRGLKPKRLVCLFWIPKVAPHVGAWIETFSCALSSSMRCVAPHVGAWIETLGSSFGSAADSASHPMWVRGLKQPQGVASGAQAQSHPMWVRGLKLYHS